MHKYYYITTAFKIIALISGLLLLQAQHNSANAAEAVNIKIGAGIAREGIYYPASNALCRFINRGHKNHNIKCNALSTRGSIHNLSAIRNDEIDVAVVQSDWHYYAYNGGNIFKKQQPFTNLRSLFSLYSEVFTVIVKDDGDINSISDLLGKRVNLGNPGSGHRATMESLMNIFGWKRRDFKNTSERHLSNVLPMLCDGKLDALVLSGGHPNQFVSKIANECDIKIVSFSDEEIKKITDKHPFYIPTIIPAGMYPGQITDVRSFGMHATFVAKESLDDESAYQIVKALFDNFDNFKRLNPVFINLRKENMMKDGLFAPLHPGAIRYLEENQEDFNNNQKEEEIQQEEEEVTNEPVIDDEIIPEETQPEDAEKDEKEPLSREESLQENNGVIISDKAKLSNPLLISNNINNLIRHYNNLAHCFAIQMLNQILIARY